MEDTIFGLLLIGTFTGVIPAIVAIIIFQAIKFFTKGMVKAAKVIVEKEPPKPVVRNIREELWDERDGDALQQYRQEMKDQREARNA
jgi:hypothetical protein